MRSFAVALACLALGCGGDGSVASPASTAGPPLEAGSLDATAAADAGSPDAAAEASADATRDAGSDASSD